jgi:hypothetical protein
VDSGEVSMPMVPGWGASGVLSVRREGNAAEIPEMEQGARLAHSVPGQWGQSECIGRVHDGAGPWWPTCSPPG